MHSKQPLKYQTSFVRVELESKNISRSEIQVISFKNHKNHKMSQGENSAQTLTSENIIGFQKIQQKLKICPKHTERRTCQKRKKPQPQH